MRLIAAFALIALSAGCAGLDSGWQLTRGMRPANGARIPKIQPITLERGTGVTDTGGKLVYVSGKVGVRSLSQFVEAQAFGGYGGLERALPVEMWRGKKLHISLRLKNEGAARGYFIAQVNRFDGDAIRTLAQRTDTGSGVWETHHIVVDVPQNANDLFLYAGFTGDGALWVEGLTLEAAAPGEALSASMPVRSWPNYASGYGYGYRPGARDGCGGCYGYGYGYDSFSNFNTPSAYSGMAPSTISDIRSGSSLK